MPSYAERRHLPYTPAEMFALVADVERYPEFLPWCVGLEVQSREFRDTQEILTAEMTVSLSKLRERFVSRVTLDPDKRRIDVEYIDGPFRTLVNEWRFEPGDAGGAMIDFFIDFEFRSRGLSLLMTAVFRQAVERMVAAFESRAHQIYARRPTRIS